MTEQRRYPWGATSATGVGSYSGRDPDEALRTVVGELPELPHLPELPDRGVGADLTGRSAATLVEFPVEVQPSGWRVTGRPGRDLWRARGMLARDLDALEEHTQGYQGPLKLQLAGPWTLAATVELPNGERLLSDRGAVADLCASYIEGLTAHLAEAAKRVPGAHLVLQVDEPALPGALRGSIPTASGYGRVPAVEPVTAEERLRSVFAAVAEAGATGLVHCCAPDPPVELMQRCGAGALGVPATRLGRAHDEAIGTAVEAGMGLFLGVVPAEDLAAAIDPAPALSDPAATVDPVRRMWHRIGFAPDLLTRTVVTTPTCGLAGAAPEQARAALAACRAAARVLRDEPSR